MRDKITLFELPDNDDRGVSPVIGVILMVAITVILAAVIASFVLGFGDSVNENVSAGADVSVNDDGTATVTWISEGTADNLNVSVEGGNNTAELNEVGDSISIEYNSGGTASSDINIASAPGNTTTAQVTVTGVGSEGTRTVITQEDVTLEDQDP